MAGVIALGGKPEFPVSDGKGSVYDNIEDKNEIVRIDSKELKVTAHWVVAPCESPSGLAMDRANRRLFAVCDNKIMAVVDADSGKVVATPAIGAGPDAAAYDEKAKRGLFFERRWHADGDCASGQKTGTRWLRMWQRRKAPGQWRWIRIHTALYLSCAEYGAAPAATVENPHPRKAVLPGSFGVLVMDGGGPR